jgi:hypothetical protein
MLLAPGVRFPLAVEARFDPRADVAQVEVDAGAGGVWVPAHAMPV